MLFNSLSFLGFFGVLAVIFYLIPHRLRWLLLLAASAYFYAAFSVGYLVLLGGVTGVAYVGGRAVAAARGPRRRLALATSVVAVLGALVVFKYYDFAVRSLEGLLALIGVGADGPLFPRLGVVVAVGLSFFTFSCVSYLADVHAGRLPAERHLGYFALYVSFFPKLLAGPIERAGPFLAQVKDPVPFRAANVTAGLQLMLWGLFKKVVIADRLALFVDDVYQQPSLVSLADLAIATYFFAFQLYCDFSGYSDMAVGAARVLGIDLMRNFRRPYLSVSIHEFWTKRWHLSLAAWFRDYMYIPMGGSRVSRLRHYANILAVFLVSGLWHGASWTFVVWGGLNGLYQVVALAVRETRTGSRETLPRAGLARAMVRGLATFHLILLTWVFFRAASLGDAITVLSRVVTSLPELPGQLVTRLTANGDFLLSITLIGALMGIEVVDERRSMWERLDTGPLYVRWGAYYAVLVTLVVLGTWSRQQFVYMQF